MKKLYYLFIILLISVVMTSCGLFRKTTNEITNKVTNEITQTVIDYQDNITVEDLEMLVQTTMKKVEHSVLGVTLKIVSTSKVSGNNV